ncbi:transcription elongation factor GreA [Dehalococcoidia bacterium]|nr:transcription elongation factor GreA [Dehalococcoidia bacterium]
MDESGSNQLLTVVGTYVGSLRNSDASVERELRRFVKWCGPDKDLSQIQPSLIGDYADSVAGTGTTPQAAERLQVVRKFLTYAKKKGIIDVNLAQHVRARKTRKNMRGIERTEVNNKIQLTLEGHTQLVDQLEALKSQRGPLAKEIQKAAADKDVRENSPLEAAREQLGQVESRIVEIEGTLNNAVVIDSHGRSSQVVSIGTVVWLQEADTGRKSRYTLVSASEANPMDSKISDVSPLGKALLGQNVDQMVMARTPRGDIRYRIVQIS